MNALRNPKWLLLVNTLPLALAALLCWSEYGVIHTLLPAASLAQWH